MLFDDCGHYAVVFVYREASSVSRMQRNFVASKYTVVGLAQLNRLLLPIRGRSEYIPSLFVYHWCIR